MRLIASALCAVAALAYAPAPLLRKATALRAKEETTWAGSDVDPWNPITEDRVFEV